VRDKVPHHIISSSESQATEVGRRLLEREARQRASLKKIPEADLLRVASDTDARKLEDLFADLGYGKNFRAANPFERSGRSRSRKTGTSRGGARALVSIVHGSTDLQVGRPTLRMTLTPARGASLGLSGFSERLARAFERFPRKISRIPNRRTGLPASRIRIRKPRGSKSASGISSNCARLPRFPFE